MKLEERKKYIMKQMVVWHLFLLLAIASGVITVGVHSQLDSHGFIGIDCGLAANSSYFDKETNLTFVSDEQFIDTGCITNITNSSNISYNLTQEYLSLRYFPMGARNCYTIKSLSIGHNYLVRGTFWYGNYDRLDKPPVFDLYLGPNFWKTVNASSISYAEIMVRIDVDHLELCLIDNGHGIPFISSILLKRLDAVSYPNLNSTQALILKWRYNLGAGNDGLIRYPKDADDRWWWNHNFNLTWTEISTNYPITYPIQNNSILYYYINPALVMQTAATTSSTQDPLVIQWTSDDKSAMYNVILYIAEIQETSRTGRREFNIFSNGRLLSPEYESYVPVWLEADWISYIETGFTDYNLTLVATSRSSLPPLLNAIEVYTIAPVIWPSTYAPDVAAINSIKKYYKIKKGWTGEPCLPSQFAWTGISCHSDSENILRITSLNLSYTGLTDSLTDAFGNLSALVSMDLSANNLSGSLPNSLDQLTALTYLFGDIYQPPPSSSPRKNVIIIAIVVVFIGLLITTVIAIVMQLKRKKHYKWKYAGPTWEAIRERIPKLGSRQFSYNDLKKITNNFKNIIGTGGFGTVYLGTVGGVQVAVKMHSHSSAQGVKELMAEAESLTKVRHKNLVLLKGYCVDENCMALLYEYMEEGNLHDKLKDKERPLAWKQRLQIAYESALGLEYLHEACNPPLIHRDVKTSNILLSSDLKAKIADFGLCRTFSNNSHNSVSHVSTKVVGTPGYLDPEYYSSNKLSTKSDVFSFGVVLLEIITGLPPIMESPDGENLVEWVHQKLSEGDIESIVDTRMGSEYDVNSIWKVINLACKCTELISSERPAMAEVAAELKESLDLEISIEEMHNNSTDIVTDVGQNYDSEITCVGGMHARSPSVR